MSSRFITYPISVDAQDLIQRAFAYLQAKNPNWEPSEGQLDTWMLEATASEAADIGTLTGQVPKSIYRNFGQSLFGLPSLDLIAATVSINIVAIDNLGHTIPADTQVGIRDSQGNLVPFLTVSDAVISAGDTEVDNVLCIAAVGGASSNGLGSIGGNVELIDILAFIDHMTQVAVTTGGQDAETDDAYLDRLSLELQTMSPRPILPNDFSILARNVSGIQRATTIDGYNPTDGTFNNERMVTIYSVDSNGLGIDTPTKAALDTYMTGMREVNFIVNTDDPTVNQIDISAHFIVLSTYDLSDTQSRVYSAIADYGNPRLWGISPVDNPNDPKTWANTNTVYYLELASVINNIPGVDRVTLLNIGEHGGALSADDYVMSGIVPLPEFITITVIGSYS